MFHVPSLAFGSRNCLQQPEQSKAKPEPQGLCRSSTGIFVQFLLPGV